MSISRKIVLSVVLLILISFVQKPTKKFLSMGKYQGQTPSRSYQEVVLKKDSTFYKYQGGCFGSYDYKGTWTINGDTLVLKSLLFKSPNEKNKEYRPLRKSYSSENKYIIKRDTLINFNLLTDTSGIYIEDTLVKNRKQINSGKF